MQEGVCWGGGECPVMFSMKHQSLNGHDCVCCLVAAVSYDFIEKPVYVSEMMSKLDRRRLERWRSHKQDLSFILRIKLHIYFMKPFRT